MISYNKSNKHGVSYVLSYRTNFIEYWAEAVNVVYMEGGHGASQVGGGGGVMDRLILS